MAASKINNAAPCIFWSQAEDVGKEGNRKESSPACFLLNLHHVPCWNPFMGVKLERNHFPILVSPQWLVSGVIICKTLEMSEF